MKNITNITELQERLDELQIQQKEEGIALKAELITVMEDIKPVHLLAKGIKEVIASPEVKNELFSLTLGIGAGYVAKKIVIGNSDGPIQEIAGNILGMVVSKNVASNSDKIRSSVLLFINEFLFKKNKNVKPTNNQEEC